jgi:hypothetical protein
MRRLSGANAAAVDCGGESDAVLRDPCGKGVLQPV